MTDGVIFLERVAINQPQPFTWQENVNRVFPAYLFISTTVSSQLLLLIWIIHLSYSEQASNRWCIRVLLCVITPNDRTREQEMQEGRHCLETGDAWMEYRGDKWRTLSVPASKMGPNLLICSCQLCFCVPGNLDQLTGRGCKRQQSEVVFNHCLIPSQPSFFFCF